ncbi:MAG: M20/M25/M40 family metallo-hydrolase [Pseudomonadota bacterium]|nr:M20/M25/M40 family metallo-hydrolase [Pseudomonadota bacterium]
MRAGDWRLIGVCAAILGALFLKGLPLALPEVREANPPGAFDATRAAGRLERILGDERPHPVDSDENDAVRARLLAEIEALGYAPEVRDDFVCSARFNRTACARVQNVVFRAGPAAGRAVMIAAHYDSVPAGPGASDDGAGVATALEIAALLAERRPTRPVVFLITDGEEMGLLGAKSFAEIDPLRDQISRVVNVEARGVSGPAMMFETGQPNGADMRVFAAGAARPFANSAMTDIYRLLPNDTDVSEFLPIGYGAINLAFSDHVEFYHTPRDTLAALDRRSLQHMGDLALASLDESLAESGASRDQLIFTDIASRAFLMLPQAAGGILLGLGAVLSLVAFARAGGGGAWRALAAPPLTLLVAGGLAFGLQALVGALRPQTLYWFAWPQATQALAYFSAAVAAAAVMTVVARGAGARRLAASAWSWFALIGLAGFFLAPGASILFALPVAVYAAGVAIAFAAPGADRAGAWAGAILALIILAPALYVTEIGLGFAIAAVPALVAALLFIAWTPLAVADEGPGPAPLALAGAGLAAAFVAVLAVPAYSPEKPRPLNLQYYVDADARTARWLISSTGEAAPEAMSAVAPFEPAEIEPLGERLAAPAPFLETAPPTLDMIEETKTADGRRLRFRINTAGADQTAAQLPAEAGAVALWAAGRRTEMKGGEGRSFVCFGRACDGAELEIEIGAEPVVWTLLGVHYGLPYAAAPLVSARPATATAIQNGDVLIVSTKTKI